MPLRNEPGFPVIINEVMASNNTSLKDPQDDFDDWIELHNTSEKEIDLSGKRLTDSLNPEDQWAIPANTIIPAGGYLIVWADNDKPSDNSLHAGFQLSKDGETVRLLNEEGSAVLDKLQFISLPPDVSFGRTPDGATRKLVKPTPGSAN
ncbi:MAG: lamin tail domain-containing protein [Fuerstiella sp.]|nr:lamin tail domain-containing protein [Fuerstiella sp.]